MSKSLTATATIDYNTWSPTSSRNFVLYGTAMIASGATFNGTVTITDSSSPANTVANWSLPSTSGNKSVYLGHENVNPSSYTYPLIITADMTVSGTTLSSASDSTQKMGTKIESGNDVPISFESVIYFNDQGKDNDYNDCVLNFSLFNQSSD